MHRNRDEEDPWLPPTPPSASHPSAASQSHHGTLLNETEKAMQKSTEENDDIAVRSVLEMGYSKSTVDAAAEHLRKQGMLKGNMFIDILRKH